MNVNQFINKVVLTSSLVLSSMIIAPKVSAQSTPLVDEKAKPIIAKVIARYGGKALQNATAIKITDHNKGPWPGESEHPGVPEIWRINEELTIDFENKRKSLLSYRVPRTDLDLEKWIFDGDTKIKYDIFHKKYSYENWMTYSWLGGSIVRGSDTMLAKRLDCDLKQVTFTGNEFYRGKVHNTLSVTTLNDAEFQYYVEADTGLITKMVRKHPRFGALTYVFSNHSKTDGVTFSRDMNFFVGDELRLTSVKRGIELNPALHKAFEPMSNFTHWGEEVDSKDMKVKKLAGGTYQVGKGRALSVFVEHEKHFIALGGARGLLTNFDALKTEVGTNKPVKYLVVTHHHRGNLAGLVDVVNSGIKLIAAEAHQATINDSLPDETSRAGHIWVSDQAEYSIGKLNLIDIATAHSKHYLLVHLPEEQLLYAEEHYETQLKTAAPRVFKDMVTFRQILDSLNLDVKTLVDGHSWRQFTMHEFRKYTDNFVQPICPSGYEVCTEG